MVKRQVGQEISRLTKIVDDANDTLLEVKSSRSLSYGVQPVDVSRSEVMFLARKYRWLEFVTSFEIGLTRTVIRPKASSANNGFYVSTAGDEPRIMYFYEGGAEGVGAVLEDNMASMVEHHKKRWPHFDDIMQSIEDYRAGVSDHKRGIV